MTHFGKMSDRTTSRLGMRRPWMLIGLVGGSFGILIVALAPQHPAIPATRRLYQDDPDLGNRDRLVS